MAQISNNMQSEIVEQPILDDSYQLNERDTKFLNDQLEKVNSPTFGVQKFIEVLTEMAIYFKSPEYLGVYEQLLNLPRATVLARTEKDTIEKDSYLLIPPCFKANKIVNKVFESPKVMKYWRQLNSSKLESRIGPFCESLHSQDLKDLSSVSEFIGVISLTLKKALDSGEPFTINYGRNQEIEISDELIKLLGRIICIRGEGIIILDPEHLHKTFFNFGAGTFIVLIERIISRCLSTNSNIYQEVEKSFSKGGYAYELMHLSIKAFSDNFMQQTSLGLELINDEEGSEIVSRNTLQKGVCPAGVNNIAKTFALAAISAFPKHLLEKPIEL